jgi:hypothetical protein
MGFGTKHGFNPDTDTYVSLTFLKESLQHTLRRCEVVCLETLLSRLILVDTQSHLGMSTIGALTKEMELADP